MEYGQALFLYVLLLKLADVFTIAALWQLSWYLRFQSQLLPIQKGIPEFSVYSKATFPLMLVFCAMFHVVGAYRKDRVNLGFRSLKKIVQGSVLGTLVFISTLYFLDAVHFSRVFLGLFPLVAILGLSLERIAMHFVWLTIERVLVRSVRILLIGRGEILSMYVNQIKTRNPYPVDWIGRIGPDDSKAELPEISFVGDATRVREFVRKNPVDVVVLSYPTDNPGNYNEVLETLSNEMVTVKVLPDFGKYSTFTYLSDQECGIPFLVFNQQPLGATDRFLKRALDIAVSFTVLTLFSPLYLAIALVIKLTSRGPVFYSQTRMGADGKIFPCYKFRSMRTDAEKTSGAVWAVEGDPRVTPIGRILRKTSLDEIPQFFNVLKGDMSLVGPRPERPVFVNQFRDEVPKYMLRHKMKSGITGWAQINGWRGNTSIDERIKHDLFYIGHWSHYFDIKILVLTLFKGFNDRHAY